MSNWYVGVASALVGNVLIGCALTLQKFAHNLREELKEDKTALRPSCSPDRLLPIAIAGLIGGEVGNLAGFGCASPLLISPLGAVGVLTNCFLSAVFLHVSALDCGCSGCGTSHSHLESRVSADARMCSRGRTWSVCA